MKNDKADDKADEKAHDKADDEDGDYDDEFEEEVTEHYSVLCGCSQWRFAVTHPATFEPLARSACDDFLREYLLVVDESPVSVRLLYDWGAWCYLVCNVQVLDSLSSAELGGVAMEQQPGAAMSDPELEAPDPESEGGRKRGRGGSI